MTCIVGLVVKGIVYMGGDSASSNGWARRSTQLSKVFVRDPFVIGYTDSFRMGQLLQHHLQVVAQPGDMPDETYMVRYFAEAVRKCLKDFGYTKVESNRESGGEFLVGYKGRLYCIDSDFQVNSFADGYDSVGSGFMFALGSLASTEDIEDPCKRIQIALTATEKFCATVSSPFTIVQLG